VPESPWQSFSRAAPERDYVALLSYLPLNSFWHLPRLVLYATRIQRQLRTSSGLIGYSLRARVGAKQFWTLSVWEDAADLQAFVAAPPHVAIMTALAPYMGATRFVRWSVKGSELPLRWDDALRHDQNQAMAGNGAHPAEPVRPVELPLRIESGSPSWFVRMSANRRRAATRCVVSNGRLATSIHQLLEQIGEFEGVAPRALL
jgi:hypothetical protein